jgi:predicted ATPase
MLKSITIENFFSFGKPTKIELNAGLNILVGINASGKSTIIKALQLLYETVCGKGYEKLILGDWDGFEAVRHQGIENNKIILQFEFDKEHIKSKTNETAFNSNPICEISFEKLNELQLAYKFLLYEHINTEISKHIDKVSDEVETSIIKQQIENLKTYLYFDTSLKSPIRQPVNYTVEKSLVSTGENLTTVLQAIKKYNTLSYEKIETLLQKVNPHFKDITFDMLGLRSVFMVREKHLNRTIFADHVSEGTLRFLLLLAITCNPMRGSLVCLDEPDMGLHPDMISTIADTLKEAAKTSQFIISTHSPLLLNEFDLEDIIVIEKDADNQSIAKTFNADDFAEWSNNYLAGQLWLMGKLGGKRW